MHHLHRPQASFRSPEGEETLRPPWSDLRSPGKISRLGEYPRSRWEFSQKGKERTIEGNQSFQKLILFLYFPGLQAGFRKGRGTRDQIANVLWIIKKAREFQKNIYFCFIDYAKAFDCVDHNKLENSERDGNTRPPDLPLEKPECRSGSNS